MANNLTAVIPQVLAQAVLCLREMAIMPRLVNTDYSQDLASYGDTVDIPIPSALKSRSVVPDMTIPAVPASNDVTPTKTQLQLSNWKEAPFVMSDKDITSVMNGFAPRTIQEAVKTIANDIDASILAAYTGVYGYVGTAGTTPFSASLLEAQQAYRTLNIQLAPNNDRCIVLDPFADANCVGIPVLQRVNESGSDQTLRNGRIGKALNFDFFMDQNVPTHAAGTLDSGSGARTPLSSAASAGATTINLSATSLTGTIVPGDIFTFANHSQTYVVTNTSTLTASGNTITGVTFAPALKVAVPANTQTNFRASHTVNLAFHRDAIAFASRPLLDVDAGGGTIMSMPDPVSGVVLRLEVQRVYKQTYFSLDCLWGAKLVRPELGCRIAG